MSKVQYWDEMDTIYQLRIPNPVSGNLTWLRHGAENESGLIDLMILEGTYSVDMMIDQLIKVPGLTPKTRTNWKRRIDDHILHLMTIEGDIRNQASGMGGHNLRIKISGVSGVVAFDY